MSWLPFGLGRGDAPARQDSDVSTSGPGRRTHIRLCTLNAYLIPAAFVNKDNATCKDQAGRAARIGAWLRERRVDIALLQEVWGGGQPALEAAANDTSESPADAARHPAVSAPRSRRAQRNDDGAATATGISMTSPEEEATKEKYAVLSWCGSWGVAAADALWQFASGRGGLWVAHRTGSSQCPISDAPLGVRWMRYSKSKTRSRKGAVAARFRAYTADGRPTSLVVVNTHVDPMNTDGVIEHQFAELMDFVRDAVLGANGLLAPSADGFGGDAVPPLVGGGLDCAVVLCGDFNADAEGALGKRLLAAAKSHAPDAPTDVRDLYAEYRGWLPRAPTYDCKKNRLVMWPQQDRLDWVLSFDRLCGVPLRCVSVKDARVHEHAGCGGGADDEVGPFSDHWPVTVDIQL